MKHSDIVGWTPLNPIGISQFDGILSTLIKDGWRVEDITETIPACVTCQRRTTVIIILTNHKEDRVFDMCLTCGTVTEQQAVYADSKPSKRQSKSEVLKTLVDQIPQLAGASVVFKRGHGYYVYTGSDAPIYFQYYDVALRWLTDWIITGKRPSDSRRRVGANRRLA